MPKAVRDHLLNALEDLDQVQFKRFKWRLGGFDLGKRRIPRGLLERAGALDLSDLLLSFYREDGAVTVTAAVLEAINCRRQAEGLLSATRDGCKAAREAERMVVGSVAATSTAISRQHPPQSAEVHLPRDLAPNAFNTVQIPVPSTCDNSGRNGMQPPSEQHFIERHREALIQRTVSVDAILDQLYGTILDNEQYERVFSKGTNQEKMRELYRLLPSWNLYCKDQLYEALKVKNKFLIDDLEWK